MAARLNGKYVHAYQPFAIHTLPPPPEQCEVEKDNFNAVKEAQQKIGVSDGSVDPITG